MKNNEIIWSYSRVNCYDTCPRCFDLCYNQKVDKLDNAFAQWGSLVHKCLELYFRNELDLFSLADYYSEHYDEFVTAKFPYNVYSDIEESYYNAGEEYLSNFAGLDTKKYEVIGVEQEFQVTVGGNSLRGFIDLILKDKTDGSYIIVDHKSASSLQGKKLKKYLIQLYLYSEYVHKEFGRYPKTLVFNLFRTGKLIREPFDKSAFDNAVNWFSESVNRAINDKEFTDRISLTYSEKGKDIAGFSTNDYFCNNICSARASCQRSVSYEGGDVDWLLINP